MDKNHMQNDSHLNMGKDIEENKVLKREKWSNKIDFLATMASSCIGLGNVWRFPYLCHQNGGGAFLLPYIICVIFGGIPLFFLEISLGQLTSAGVLTAWKICPLMQGIGVASVLIQVFGFIYYIIVMSWAILYFYFSFSWELPWSHCKNYWNTANCSIEHYYNNSLKNNIHTSATNSSYSRNSSHLSIASSIYVDPITEFWDKKVLQISSAIDEVGYLNWELTLCLFIAWTLVYLCVFKGIKVTGKLMYITATLPILLLISLFIRGITLPGSLHGVKYYLIPKFNRLMDFKVWADAGSQVFYTYSLCIGSTVAMGSYNELYHNSWKDCLILATINSLVSLTAGFVVFTTLGFMSYQQNIKIEDVAASGPGLAFIAYPKAVMEMPLAPLWSILFFLMILMLGMGTQIVNCEGFLTAITDAFPTKFNTQLRKAILALVAFCVSYLLGLTMVTNGGMYVFQLIDYYAIGRNVLMVGCLEVITVAYLYGIKRYCSDLKSMLGFNIGPYLKVSWLITCPIYTLATFGMMVSSYSEIKYNGIYTYPKWAVGVGWLLSLIPIALIPLLAVLTLFRKNGSLKQRFKAAIRPAINPASVAVNRGDQVSTENIKMEIITTPD